MNTKMMAHSVRYLLTLLGAIVGIIFAVTAEGQVRARALITPAKQVFPWGSVQKLQAFGATNVNEMVLALYGSDASTGELVPLNVPSIDYLQTYANYTQFNTAFHQVLAIAGQQAISNAPANVNLNVPLQLGMYALTWDYPPGSLNAPFATSDNVLISLVKQGTKYSMPNTTAIEMPLAPQQQFYVPGLQWIRIEVYSNNLASPFYVLDSRDESTATEWTSLDMAHQSFYIETKYVTSGSTGPYQLKVSYLTPNSFVVVNGDGMQVQETPSVLSKFSVHGQTVNLTASGGDAGRRFIVQGTSDTKLWTNMPPSASFTVGTNANFSVALTFTDNAISLTHTSPKMRLYRLIAVNQAP